MKASFRKCLNACLSLFAVVAMFAGGSSAYAEDPATLTVTEIVPAADITTLISNMSSSIGGPVKTALGVSAGFVILAIIWRVVTKYMKRGA